MSKPMARWKGSGISRVACDRFADDDMSFYVVLRPGGVQVIVERSENLEEHVEGFRKLEDVMRPFCG